MLDLQKIKQNKTTKELLEFGIINIDKSSGPTSFQVSELVKKKLKLRKTSHFGTLDPKVTGVLPVSLNRACKLMGYFLGEDKTYIGIMRIHEDIELEKIQEKINEKFLGEIIQMPPVKSRVKRQLRPRTIYEFKVLEKQGKDVLFKVSCEGGTYVRTLCVDLGEELKIGAHMLELRRTKAGIFEEDTLVNLYDFEKAFEEYEKGNEELLKNIIIPAEIVTELHEPIQIKEDNITQILTGKPIHQNDLVEKQDLEKDKIVSIFHEVKFIGMYKVLNEEGIFAKAEFVMQEIR
ncbi:RNA-guided pseudouridylation complex pseudouridine synthase subunit Cbf5 [archaeon]|jgi:H/ACA ribonucleoprotein complex subunit 4|nr:RNA-guided pseudouridylation complex pseudouridine synthase subunit Cbf5 [archaeon]